MIFVTVGSHPTRTFQRLLDALRPLPAQDLVVQHGPGRCPPGVAYACPWLPFSEIREYMEQATAVITHAGAGTILCARNLGHTPIVMPRLKRFDEVVDDHQVGLATALETTRLVVVAWTADQLPALVAAASPRRVVCPNDHGPLQDAVRAALTGRAQ